MNANDSSNRPPIAVTTVIRVQWRLVALVAVVGLVLGLIAGAILPVRYTAQAQVIAGATSVNAAAVPSFAEAGRSLAETYSRVFLSDGVRTVLAERFNGQVPGDVSASPIAGSSVILIEATSTTEENATALADAGVDALVTVIAGLLDNAEAVDLARSNLDEAFVSLGTAQAELDVALDVGGPASTRAIEAAAGVQTAQTAVDAYAAELNSAIGDSSQANGVQRLVSASPTSDNFLQRFELYGAGGLLIGVLAGSAFAVVRHFRRVGAADSNARGLAEQGLQKPVTRDDVPKVGPKPRPFPQASAEKEQRPVSAEETAAIETVRYRRRDAGPHPR